MSDNRVTERYDENVENHVCVHQKHRDRHFHDVKRHVVTVVNERGHGETKVEYVFETFVLVVDVRVGKRNVQHERKQSPFDGRQHRVTAEKMRKFYG